MKSFLDSYNDNINIIINININDIYAININDIYAYKWDAYKWEIIRAYNKQLIS